MLGLLELFNKMMKSIEVNKNLWAAMACTVRSVRLVGSNGMYC